MTGEVSASEFIQLWLGLAPAARSAVLEAIRLDNLSRQSCELQPESQPASQGLHAPKSPVIP